VAYSLSRTRVDSRRPRLPEARYRDDTEDDGRIYGVEYPSREEMIGGIVGVATIVDCVTRSCSKWFNGPCGVA
jgi:hypothetical protein